MTTMKYLKTKLYQICNISTLLPQNSEAAGRVGVGTVDR